MRVAEQREAAAGRPSEATDAPKSRPGRRRKTRKKRDVVGLRVPKALLSVEPPDDEALCGALVRRCQRARQRYLLYVRAKAEQLGAHRRARVCRYYCAVEAFRIAALVHALEGQGIAVGAEGSKWSYRRVIEVGRQLSPYGAEQWVGAIGVEKGDGDSRVTYAFSLLDRARQKLMHDIARLLTPLHPRQFLYKGGDPAFWNWLQSELPKANIVLVTDVPACHHVVDRDLVVKGLPLPSRAVQAQLIDPPKRARLVGPHGAPTGFYPFPSVSYAHTAHSAGDHVGELVPGRGIAPGSALASLAAEVVVRDLLVSIEGAAHCAVAASFADNIIVLLQREEDVEPVKKALVVHGAPLFGNDASKELLRRAEHFPPDKMPAFLGRIPKLTRYGVILRACQSHLDRIETKANADAVDATALDMGDRVTARLKGFGTRHAGDDRAVRHVIDLAWSIALDVGEARGRRARVPPWVAKIEASPLARRCVWLVLSISSAIGPFRRVAAKTIRKIIGERPPS